MCCYFKTSVKLNTSTLLDTVINYRFEATRVLSTTSLQLEATGIPTSTYINQMLDLSQKYLLQKTIKNV